MNNEYKKQHERRMKMTISMLSNYVTGREKTLNIGVSDIDDLLLSFFQDIYFGIPTDMYVPLDDVKRRLIQLDIANRSEMTEKFGTIIFTEVMEHLMIDDELIIRNICSLLATHGILVLSVPNAATFLNRFKILFGRNVYWDKVNIIRGVYGGFGHIREYTFSEVQRLLSTYFDII